MNGFSCHTRIFSGVDALTYLDGLQCSRVLVVTDSFFAGNGTAERLAARVSGAKACIFGDVTPDPDLALVARGVQILDEFQPDCILALGGGSPMDCAKAMRYLSERRITLVAIPTTSGTGSEVTTFAIVTKDGAKLPLVDDALAPEVALLDPSLLQELPKGLIADAGFDILAHCLEAAAATGATAMSAALAGQAFAYAYASLTASYRGDTSVRLAIHEAACMAGIAFNSAGLGACHALSHALGGQFHTAHGRLNAILLPQVIERNADAALPAYGALAIQAGISGATDRMRLRNLLSGLRRLRSTLGLPETLAQAGIARPELIGSLDRLCRTALADRCLSTNPVPLDAAELEAILRAVAG